MMPMACLRENILIHAIYVTDANCNNIDDRVYDDNDDDGDDCGDEQKAS